MNKRSWLVSAGAVVAIGAFATVGFADSYGNSSSSSSPRSDRESMQSNENTGVSGGQSGSQTGQLIRVDEHFTRTVADNCTYTGSLTGSLHQVEHRSLASNLYRANLSLRGDVRCPDGYVRRLSSQNINEASISGDDLKNMIQSRGEIRVDHAGRLCTISPTFDFRGDRLVASENFNQSCHETRGGGPGVTNSNRNEQRTQNRIENHQQMNRDRGSSNMNY